MTFRYGQRHSSEIEAARRVARHYGVRDHVVVDIDLRTFGGSALTADIAVPKDRYRRCDRRTGIPITYVPARNTIFLSFCLAWAEVLGAVRHLHRRERAGLLGLPGLPPRVRRRVPAHGQPGDARRRGRHHADPHRRRRCMTSPSARSSTLGRSLGVDYSITLSCYDPTPEGMACGRCDACRLRLKGFAEAGLADPAPYASSPG